MTRMTRRIAIVAATVLVTVLVFAACTRSLKYRERRLAQQIHFSHALHAEQAACSDCHAGVSESPGPTRGQFIGQEEHGGCAACHDVASEEACAQCHLDQDPAAVRLSRRDRRLKFSHARHGPAAVPDGCGACHAAALTADAAGTPLVGGHETCRGCHGQALAEARCEMCHENLQRQAERPSGILGHEGNFLARHGKIAQDSARCAACHDQTYCADCHARTVPFKISVRYPEKTTAQFIHRGDFIARHAAEARAAPSSCNRCHGTSYCTSCHQLQGVSVAPGGASPTVARNVHGPDWMQPGTAGFHGMQARRGIGACASCHDRGAASNCVNCHRVGGLGGNPHPRGFRWSNKQHECRNNGMCAACHAGGAGCG